jgi:hypothetical protein
MTVSPNILYHNFIHRIHSEILFLKTLTGHHILISPGKVKLSDLPPSPPPSPYLVFPHPSPHLPGYECSDKWYNYLAVSQDRVVKCHL